MKVLSTKQIAWQLAAGGTLCCAVAAAAPLSPSVKAAQAQSDSRLVDKLEQVLRWTLGPGDRLPTPDATRPTANSPLTKPKTEPPKPEGKPKPQSQLLLVPLAPGQKPRQLAAGDAMSFLPSPTEPRLVYLITAGQLQSLDTQTGVISEIPFSSQLPSGLRLKRLLGYSASNNLLVEMEFPNRDGQALWQLTLQAGQVAGGQVPDENIKDRAAFFAAFRVPRCQSADRDCLVVKQLGPRSYISKESQADTSIKPLTMVKDLSESRCYDLYGATWASAKTCNAA